MRPELEEIKLWEDFLTNNLPEELMVDTEIRLLWDQDWQQSLTQQQLAYDVLQAAGRQQLRLELKTIHVRLFS